MRWLRDQSGDTLIEVVFGLTILGVVLVSCTGLAAQAFRLGQSSKERNQATNLAQQQAERLRNLRDALVDPVHSTGWPSFASAAQGSGGATSAFCLQWDTTSSKWHAWDAGQPQCKTGNYTITVTPSPDPNPSNHLITYNITVSWQDFAGGSSSTTVATILGDEDQLALNAPPPSPLATPTPATPTPSGDGNDSNVRCGTGCQGNGTGPRGIPDPKKGYTDYTIYVNNSSSGSNITSCTWDFDTNHALGDAVHPHLVQTYSGASACVKDRGFDYSADPAVKAAINKIQNGDPFKSIKVLVTLTLYPTIPGRSVSSRQFWVPHGCYNPKGC